MEKYNFYKLKFISNLIYFLSIPCISFILLTLFYKTDLLNIKGFMYSYFLGFFLIFILSIIFNLLTSIEFDNTNKDLTLKNEQKQKTTRLKNIKIADEKQEKITIKNIIFLISIVIYIVVFINFIKNPLKNLNFSSGLINLIIYFGKILLFSGIIIPLNIILTSKKIFSNKSLVFYMINKLLFFIITSLLFLHFFDLKGLAFTISLLEILDFIFKITYIKFINKKNKE